MRVNVPSKNNDNFQFVMKPMFYGNCRKKYSGLSTATILIVLLAFSTSVYSFEGWSKCDDSKNFCNVPVQGYNDDGDYSNLKFSGNDWLPDNRCFYDMKLSGFGDDGKFLFSVGRFYKINDVVHFDSIVESVSSQKSRSFDGNHEKSLKFYYTSTINLGGNDNASECVKGICIPRASEDEINILQKTVCLGRNFDNVFKVPGSSFRAHFIGHEDSSKFVGQEGTILSSPGSFVYITFDSSNNEVDIIIPSAKWMDSDKNPQGNSNLLSTFVDVGKSGTISMKGRFSGEQPLPKHPDCPETQWTIEDGKKLKNVEELVKLGSFVAYKGCSLESNEVIPSKVSFSSENEVLFTQNHINFDDNCDFWRIFPVGRGNGKPTPRNNGDVYSIDVDEGVNVTKIASFTGCPDVSKFISLKLDEILSMEDCLVDSDGDGVIDCKDQCRFDGEKTKFGLCGCGVSDVDSDGDGIPDCADPCPDHVNAPSLCGCGVDTSVCIKENMNEYLCGVDNIIEKKYPSVCGCFEEEIDTDGDGFYDCEDMCPNDPYLRYPGVCGCGKDSTDKDGDGFLGCEELCPLDSKKTLPLICGCGNSEIDSDGDGVPNCKDYCPNDASISDFVPGVKCNDNDESNDKKPVLPQKRKLNSFSDNSKYNRRKILQVDECEFPVQVRIDVSSESDSGFTCVETPLNCPITIGGNPFLQPFGNITISYFGETTPLTVKNDVIVTSARFGSGIIDTMGEDPLTVIYVENNGIDVHERTFILFENGVCPSPSSSPTPSPSPSSSCSESLTYVGIDGSSAGGSQCLEKEQICSIAFGGSVQGIIDDMDFTVTSFATGAEHIIQVELNQPNDGDWKTDNFDLDALIDGSVVFPIAVDFVIGGVAHRYTKTFIVQDECDFGFTRTPSPSQTSEPSDSQTPTSDPSASQTPTSVPSSSQTSEPSESQTPTSVPSASQTSEPSGSQTPTSVPSASQTPTSDPSDSQTSTPEPSDSQTSSVSKSVTGTLSVSLSGTTSMSLSGTTSMSLSGTTSVSASATETLSVSLSGTSSVSVSVSKTSSLSLSGTSSVSESSSKTSSLSLSGTPSVSDSSSKTPSLSLSGTPSVSDSSTQTPSFSPTGTSSETSSVSLSSAPSPSNTASSTPVPSKSVMTSICPPDTMKEGLPGGVCGCDCLDTDTDSDGVEDCKDECPVDSLKYLRGECGCGVLDFDTDGDGVVDCHDECPFDADKVEKGPCGCGNLDIDTDGDGVLDCHDFCPNNPEKFIDGGFCGCDQSDSVDYDGDGTPDCQDHCPLDPSKIEEGVCGCGIPDIDSDSDGVFNCDDACPFNSNKMNDVGPCGCFSDEDHVDTDGDGIPDCIDPCRENPDLSCTEEDQECNDFLANLHDNDGDGFLDCNSGIFTAFDCTRFPTKSCAMIYHQTSNLTMYNTFICCEDFCENNPNLQQPDECGCQVDSDKSDPDGDHIPSCIDPCPLSPIVNTGKCPCGALEIDTDGDGVHDCVDSCPLDPWKAKTQGICGCGRIDSNDGECSTCMIDDLNDHSFNVSTSIADECANDQELISGVSSVSQFSVSGVDFTWSDDTRVDFSPSSTIGVTITGTVTETQYLNSSDAIQLSVLIVVRNPLKLNSEPLTTQHDLCDECNDDWITATSELNNIGIRIRGIAGSSTGNITSGVSLNFLSNGPPDSIVAKTLFRMGRGANNINSNHGLYLTSENGQIDSLADIQPNRLGWSNGTIVDDLRIIFDIQYKKDNSCPDVDPPCLNPGQCGCGVDDEDTDGDGISDCNDICPNDCERWNEYNIGCGCGYYGYPDGELDFDGDGTLNCHDVCPHNPEYTTIAGICGCSGTVAQETQDSDGDGVVDCLDKCPHDPDKIEDEGICGCGVSDGDADNDGYCDCQDECPHDPHKHIEGQCGCHVLDTDTDGDGVADCNDECPYNHEKTKEGSCGCDCSDVDSDGDGIADCNDECPYNENKQMAGFCGCETNQELDCCICTSIESFVLRFDGNKEIEENLSQNGVEFYYSVHIFGRVWPSYKLDIIPGQHIRIWGDNFAYELIVYNRETNAVIEIVEEYSTNQPLEFTCSQLPCIYDKIGGSFTLTSIDQKTEGNACEQVCEYNTHIVLDLSLRGGLETNWIQVIIDQFFQRNTNHVMTRQYNDIQNIFIYTVWGDEVLILNDGDSIQLDGSISNIIDMTTIIEGLDVDLYPEGPSDLASNWLNVFQTVQNNTQTDADEDVVLFFVATQPLSVDPAVDFINEGNFPLLVPVTLIEPETTNTDLTISGIQSISGPHIQRDYFVTSNLEGAEKSLKSLHTVFCCPENKDACGVCYGDSHTCLDCEGVINGPSVYDSCGICGGNGTQCSPPDCTSETSIQVNHDTEFIITESPDDVDVLCLTLKTNWNCPDCVVSLTFGEEYPNPCGLTTDRGVYDHPQFDPVPLFDNQNQYCQFLWPSDFEQEFDSLWNVTFDESSGISTYEICLCSDELRKISNPLKSSDLHLSGKLWSNLYQKPGKGFCRDKSLHIPPVQSFGCGHTNDEYFSKTSHDFHINYIGHGNVGFSIESGLSERENSAIIVKEEHTYWLQSGDPRITFSTDFDSSEHDDDDDDDDEICGYYLSNPRISVDEQTGIPFHVITTIDNDEHHLCSSSCKQSWTIGTYGALGVVDFSGSKPIVFDVLTCDDHEIVSQHKIVLDVNIKKSKKDAEIDTHLTTVMKLFHGPNYKREICPTSHYGMEVLACERVYAAIWFLGKIELDPTLHTLRLCAAADNSPVELLEYSPDDPLNTGCNTKDAIVIERILYDNHGGPGGSAYTNEVFEFAFDFNSQYEPNVIKFNFLANFPSNSTKILISATWSIEDQQHEIIQSNFIFGQNADFVSEDGVNHQRMVERINRNPEKIHTNHFTGKTNGIVDYGNLQYNKGAYPFTLVENFKHEKENHGTTHETFGSLVGFHDPWFDDDDDCIVNGHDDDDDGHQHHPKRNYHNTGSYFHITCPLGQKYTNNGCEGDFEYGEIVNTELLILGCFFIFFAFLVTCFLFFVLKNCCCQCQSDEFHVDDEDTYKCSKCKQRKCVCSEIEKRIVSPGTHDSDHLVIDVEMKNNSSNFYSSLHDFKSD